jgi:hypothetical protein
MPDERTNAWKHGKRSCIGLLKMAVTRLLVAWQQVLQLVRAAATFTLVANSPALVHVVACMSSVKITQFLCALELLLGFRPAPKSEAPADRIHEAASWSLPRCKRPGIADTVAWQHQEPRKRLATQFQSTRCVYLALFMVLVWRVRFGSLSRNLMNLVIWKVRLLAVRAVPISGPHFTSTG